MRESQVTRRYCGIKELSQYTSIPVKTLYEWASLGVIPSLKIAGRVLFDLDDIDRFFLQKKRETDQFQKTIARQVGKIPSV